MAEGTTIRLGSIHAATFRAWYELLEEIVALDPDEVAEGNHRPAVMLLHDLVDIGIRNGAIRPLVTRSTGPAGFAHLTFRYPLDAEFDWSGDVALRGTPGHYVTRPDQFITELENATGINSGGVGTDSERMRGASP